MGEEIQEIQSESKGNPYTKLIIIITLLTIIVVLVIIAFIAFRNVSDSFVEDKMGDLEVTPAGISCGDGTCTQEESLNSSCPLDCEGKIEIIEIGTCGDEICDLDELGNNSCPLDCE